MDLKKYMESHEAMLAQLNMGYKALKNDEVKKHIRAQLNSDDDSVAMLAIDYMPTRSDDATDYIQILKNVVDIRDRAVAEKALLKMAELSILNDDAFTDVHHYFVKVSKDRKKMDEWELRRGIIKGMEIQTPNYNDFEMTETENLIMGTDAAYGLVHCTNWRVVVSAMEAFEKRYLKLSEERFSNSFNYIIYSVVRGDHVREVQKEGVKAISTAFHKAGKKQQNDALETGYKIIANQDKEWEVREEAACMLEDAAELGAIENPYLAFERMFEAHDDRDWKVRKAVSRAIGSLYKSCKGDYDINRVFERLCQDAFEKDKENKQITREYKSFVLDSLKEILRKVSVPAKNKDRVKGIFLESMKNSNWRVRLAAVDGMSYVYPNDGFEEIVFNCLKEKQTEFKAEALRSLKNYLKTVHDLLALEKKVAAIKTNNYELDRAKLELLEEIAMEKMLGVP